VPAAAPLAAQIARQPLWAALAVVLLCLAWIAGCNRDLTGDDLTEARAAVARQDWSLAERLLERFLREEQDPDQRWEAWRQLLTVVNAAGQEPRASLELLETMLEEYMDNDARAAVILRRMGEVNEVMHRHEAAADAWNAYIGLAGLTPRQSVEGYRRLAGMQFKLRRFDAAEDTLQQCLACPWRKKRRCSAPMTWRIRIRRGNAGRKRRTFRSRFWTATRKSPCGGLLATCLRTPWSSWAKPGKP
jgi:tetratricopeptide (TPR) repeat protein